MTKRTGRFSRSDRLLRSQDFQRVAREGRRWASPHFVVLVATRNGAVPGGSRPPHIPHDRPRLGVTASRKVGGAVQRNRVKRRVREWFRRDRDALASLRPAPFDIVVIARRGSPELDGTEVAAELSALLGTS